MKTVNTRVLQRNAYYAVNKFKWKCVSFVDTQPGEKVVLTFLTRALVRKWQQSDVYLLVSDYLW